MNEKELIKEAEEYAIEWGEKTDGTYACCRDGYLAGAESREKRIADLEKGNAELKEKNNNLVASSKTIISLSDEIEARTMKQLTKAKEIIKKFSEFVNNEVEYDSEHPQEHTDLWNELCEQAEQFLKDSEMEK